MTFDGVRGEKTTAGPFSRKLLCFPTEDGERSFNACEEMMLV